jgi:hypothetical protein
MARLDSGLRRNDEVGQAGRVPRLFQDLSGRTGPDACIQDAITLGLGYAICQMS